MRNKLNIYIAILVSFLVSTFSCNDLLDEETFGILTPQATITTPNDLRATVDGIYQTLRNSNGDRNSIVSINWLASEIVSTRTSGSEGQMDEFKIEATNELLESVFSASYEGIKRANTVIEYADNIQFSNEVEKDRLRAESRFLRAFHYFNLVRLFGPVPMHMNVSKSPSDVHKGRSATDQVYDEIIIPDLEFSIAILPEVNDDGRASSVAANMLLGKVFMTISDWESALDAIEGVISNSNHGLIDDWGDLWIDQNDNEEMIFAIQFINLPGQMNGFSNNFGITANGAMGNALYYAEWPYYNSYPEGRRKGALFLTEHVEPNGDTLRIGDPEWAQGWNQPLLRLYHDPEPSVLGSSIDIPILRYADALLMHAEVLNEINGPTTAAYNSINMVRRRAAGVAINSPFSGDLTGLSQAALRDSIFQERRWELPLEGHSFFDAQRAGLQKFTEVMSSSEPVIGSVLDPIEQYRLLMPFPSFEIQRNNLISFDDQNPGY